MKSWTKPKKRSSLTEINHSLEVPHRGPAFRKFLAFVGPGYLVAVGYMDPGNWATDIAGGSRFGYSLLSVILFSNLMAVLLQSLSSKLGIVTGHDLAQACRSQYSKPVAIGLWILCELAIAACDLAEVVGSAIALKLLFGLPLLYGVLITALDVLLILLLQHQGFRAIETLVIVLVATIGACFAVDLWLAKPHMQSVLSGFIPTPDLVADHEKLYIAIAILGATVMPHNLYLHSSIVQTRRYENSDQGKREAIRFSAWDSAIALTLALFINAAILIVSAATFHQAGMTEVADISDAYDLLTPLVGTALASILFGVALLASGQNSTLTGTLAGQIVMEGFLDIKLPPWLRRLVTRLIAVIPAVIVTMVAGEQGTEKLLILSQVILSLQLPFAVIPLVQFTGNKKIMGTFANPPWMAILAWCASAVIVVLNAFLIYQTFAG
ncbi:MULTISPECIES: Nramp family divalent metal transporter [Paenibacillus]|uniref:Divalent metal cation transporter MntH n=1 Tax=Paenibacillus albilobatus TaxID=2716884 RepID=A0A920CA55_9BACL|nr:MULTISPECIES: Nramp family divalent metal transporter [Paenibacillus]GIO31870.1 divalent metal cation transporter MntH [Paenibacillus albilobatus]